jgi:predicted nucleotidyltransferase
MPIAVSSSRRERTKTREYFVTSNALQAESSEELSVDVGDVVFACENEGIGTNHNQHWLYCCKYTNQTQRGYVPIRYLKPIAMTDLLRATISEYTAQEEKRKILERTNSNEQLESNENLDQIDEDVIETDEQRQEALMNLAPQDKSSEVDWIFSKVAPVMGEEKQNTFNPKEMKRLSIAKEFVETEKQYGMICF